MPTFAQTRIERISKLIKEFDEKNTRTLGPIYKRSLELYPFTTKEKCKDYAEVALRIVKARKKATKKEATEK